MKWMDRYSKETGVNIFKIPVKVIVMTRSGTLKKEKEKEKEKERKRIRRMLERIIEPGQILFWENLQC